MYLNWLLMGFYFVVGHIWFGLIWPFQKLSYYFHKHRQQADFSIAEFDLFYQQWVQTQPTEIESGIYIFHNLSQANVVVVSAQALIPTLYQDLQTGKHLNFKIGDEVQVSLIYCKKAKLQRVYRTCLRKIKLHKSVFLFNLQAKQTKKILKETSF